MKVRIDYLNKDKEAKHIFVDIDEYLIEYNLGDFRYLGNRLYTIMQQGATDIHIYNITKEKGAIKKN